MSRGGGVGVGVKSLLSSSITSLLSPSSLPSDHTRTFVDLSRLLADLALPPSSSSSSSSSIETASSFNLDAFLTLQDTFDFNLASILLEWLGRVIISLKKAESYGLVEVDGVVEANLTQCLGLLQGVLLIHRKSQRLFSRSSTIEIILAILEHSRLSSSSITSSPSLLTPSPSRLPSPVLFPPSPTPSSTSTRSSSASSSSSSASTTKDPISLLALAALDTLLCALVDRPKNMRAFEEVGGLKAVVKVLKDKNVGQVVRIKAIEILFYYLLPEPTSHHSSTSSSTPPTPHLSSTPSIPPIQHLATFTSDFIPQTPLKDRFSRSQILSPSSSHSHSHSRSKSYSQTSELGGSENESPFLKKGLLFASASGGTPKKRTTPIKLRRLSRSPSGRESGLKSTSESEGEVEVEDKDRTPRASLGTPLSSSRERDSLIPSSPTPNQTQGLGSRSSSLSSNGSSLLSVGSGSGRSSTTRRTEGEKREMLRKVMPNVEALEMKFRAMGLMPSVAEG